MNGIAALNGAAFALALTASTVAVWLSRPGPPREAMAGRPAFSPTTTTSAALVDQAGMSIPRRDYRHIASLSPLADEILLEICEPDRIAAFAASSARGRTHGFRFAGKPTLERLDDVERILSLHPDLVLVNGIGDPRPVARLREAGLVVFDLGEMRGLSTLVPGIHALAQILNHPERGDSFALSLVEALNSVAADVPRSDRLRAMHLSVYGDSLFGGALETSYHDVLVSAGLLEAASAFRGWPQYTAEQVLTMDPDVIVTNLGMGESLCARPGLAMLRACKSRNRIVEVDGELLGDPGPSMVEAARLVREAVYGPAQGTTGHTLQGVWPGE
jgi:iron complex transport system substrate-binding protein